MVFRKDLSVIFVDVGPLAADDIVASTVLRATLVTRHMRCARYALRLPMDFWTLGVISMPSCMRFTMRCKRANQVNK